MNYLNEQLDKLRTVDGGMTLYTKNGQIEIPPDLKFEFAEKLNESFSRDLQKCKDVMEKL